MSRSSLAFVSLLAAACVAIFGFSLLGRSPAATPDANAALGARSSADHRSAPAAESAANAAVSESTAAETVLNWIAQTTNDDPKIRAAAITALANAPRAQALPALKNVLARGEPNVDRRLALRSLAALAKQQGDADGGIRGALRDAIYHGDGTLPNDEVQGALDAVETAVQPAAGSASP